MKIKTNNYIKLLELSNDYKRDIVGGPFGSNLKATEYVSKGFPIIRLQNIDRFKFVNKNIQFVTREKANELKSHSFKGGDIVVTKLGAPLGKCCIVPDNDEFKNGVISSDIVRIRINENNYDKKYLVYHINASPVAIQLNGNTQGTTRPRVTLQDVRNLLLYVPPLPEQQRIVGKLDSLFLKIDKAIGLTKENLEHSKHMLPSALNEVFGGAEEKGWEMKKLSQMASFKNGFAFKSELFNENGIGFQVIRIGNVLNKNKNPVYIEPSLEYEKAKLLKGEIIISMTGTRTKCDYLFVSIIEEEKYYLNQRVGAITADKDISNEYLYYYLQSTLFRDRIFEYETGSVNQGNISGKDIMNMEAPNPEFPTQQKIANYLNQLRKKQEQLVAHYSKQLKQLEGLKASLLDRAFRGEL